MNSAEKPTSTPEKGGRERESLPHHPFYLLFHVVGGKKRDGKWAALLLSEGVISKTEVGGEKKQSAAVII